MRETIGQNIPYYDISILGVDDRVRGHYNNNIEGNGLITGSFETFLIYLKISRSNLSFLLFQKVLHATE